jgi:hypothetical protein
MCEEAEKKSYLQLSLAARQGESVLLPTK